MPFYTQQPWWLVLLAQPKPKPGSRLWLCAESARAGCMHTNHTGAHQPILWSAVHSTGLCLPTCLLTAANGRSSTSAMYAGTPPSASGSCLKTSQSQCTEHTSHWALYSTCNSTMVRDIKANSINVDTRTSRWGLSFSRLGLAQRGQFQAMVNKRSCKSPSKALTHPTLSVAVQYCAVNWWTSLQYIGCHYYKAYTTTTIVSMHRA